MKVLTQKEFNSKSKDSVEVSTESLLNPIKESTIPSKGKCKYYLLHPENGVGGGNLQNFEDVITIDDVKYKRSCKNGVVVTIDEPLANFLLKKGYLLMEKIEVTNEEILNGIK